MIGFEHWFAVRFGCIVTDSCKANILKHFNFAFKLDCTPCNVDIAIEFIIIQWKSRWTVCISSLLKGQNVSADLYILVYNLFSGMVFNPVVLLDVIKFVESQYYD